MGEVSNGARQAFAALERRTKVAETKAAEAEARAKAAEARADKVEHAEARADRIAEALAEVVKRLDRLEKRGAMKAEKAKAVPLDGPLVDRREADLLYGVKAISAFLGISPRQGLGLVERGHLPTFRVGKGICARKVSLTAWLVQQEEKA